MKRHPAIGSDCNNGIEVLELFGPAGPWVVKAEGQAEHKSISSPSMFSRYGFSKQERSVGMLRIRLCTSGSCLWLSPGANY